MTIGRHLAGFVFAIFLSMLTGGCAGRQHAAPSADHLKAHAELPDPLVMNDGTRVKTEAQWRQRRGEMKVILEHYLLGTAPPTPNSITSVDLDHRDVRGGTVEFRRVKLNFGPEDKLGFEAAVFVPKTGRAPFPTIVMPWFYPTPGSAIVPTTLPAGATTAATTRNAAYWEDAKRKSDPEDAAKDTFAPALDRGYAVMTFYYQQCGLDKKDYRQSGFFPAYPDYDWADLAAWAWGMSRCVDYLENQPFADKTKFIALGHSRLGKTTLVAGAMDERFALVAPAGSGCCGTGAFRFNGKTRGGKEGLENVLKMFPQWISPRMGQFADHVEQLPFDQNWLIALCAPRPFIAADATGDPYCNGNALKQSWLAAKPVYDFLHATPNLGVHFRDGGHELAAADWKAILDFADERLMGIDHGETFDHFPPAEKLH